MSCMLLPALDTYEAVVTVVIGVHAAVEVCAVMCRTRMAWATMFNADTVLDCTGA